MDDRRYSELSDSGVDSGSRKSSISKLNALRLFRRSASRASSFESSPAVKITCRVESPPILFHGSTDETAGAFFSGQLAVEVNEDVIELESFVASFKLHVMYKRPFQSHCEECQHRYIQLESWQLLREPTTLLRGTHLFPFSTHLDGSQPTTADTPIFSISYELKAEAMVINQTPQTPSANEQPGTPPNPSPIKFELAVPVKRCIQEPLYPSCPLHIFPPTEITAAASYIPTIHPTGTNTIQLKVDGLSRQGDGDSDARTWALSQVNWKLEENIKATVPACGRHQRGAHTVRDEIKGILRDQARIIGGKELREGWDSVDLSPDGTLNLEIEFGLDQAIVDGDSYALAKYAFGTELGDGTEISHTLLVDLIVTSQDQSCPKQSTDVCRRLRMRFNMILTSSSGASISWDNEPLPIYGDVSTRPPEYFTDDN